MTKLYLLAVLLPALYNGMVGLQIPLLNPSKDVLEAGLFGKNDVNPWVWSSLVMMYHVGIVFGGILAANNADKHGRKSSLMLSSNMFAILGSVFCIVGWYGITWSFYVGRFVLGVGGGFALAILPVYILELTPPEKRGLIGGIIDCWMTIGNFLGGMFARSDILGGPKTWQWLITIGAWPALVGMLLYLVLPESPVFLANFLKTKTAAGAETTELETEKERERVAIAAWESVNGRLGSREERQAMMLHFRGETGDGKPENDGITWKLGFTQYRMVLGLGAMIGFASATTGTPVLISYSTPLFASTIGISSLTAQTMTNFLGGTEIAGGVLAAIVNHKVSRRSVMLLTLSIIAGLNILVCILLLLINYILSPSSIYFGTTGHFLAIMSIACLSILLVICSNVGPSGLGPVLCVERASPAIRAKTRTLAVALGTTIRILLDLTAWPLITVCSPALFGGFAVCAAISWLYFYQIL